MRIRLFSGVVAILTATSCIAQPVSPTDWQSAHPVTVVSVTTTASAGTYRVSATVTDAQSSKLLAEPAMLVKPGTPAVFEVGLNPGVALRFTVTVDAKGQSATYRSETLRNGSVESGYAGVLFVERGA
jgi:hypothetical protein